MTNNRYRIPESVSNDDLLGFVDGALDDDGRVRVLTYLAAHPAAVERVEAYLHQNAQLRQLREHLPMADSHAFAPDLQAELAERLRRRPHRAKWRGWAVAASLVLVIAGGSLTGALKGTRAPDPVTASASVGAPSQPQAVFLFEQPELVSTSAPSSELGAADNNAFDWLAGHITDFSLQPPSMDRIGLELVNSETFERQGIPAIRIVYRDAEGNAVLLYAGVGKPDANHAFWLMSEGHLSLQWRRGPMVFALVAPTGSPQLSDIVELVGAAVAQIPLPQEDVAKAAPPAKPLDSGPVQSIAVPVEAPAAPAAPVAAAPAPEAPAADVETINPEMLPDAEAANDPEPL
jgi:anti-sigma factor RsiW